MTCILLTILGFCFGMALVLFAWWLDDRTNQKLRKRDAEIHYGQLNDYDESDDDWDGDE